jgi:CheY-like chemotaxis protein
MPAAWRRRCANWYWDGARATPTSTFDARSAARYCPTSTTLTALTVYRVVQEAVTNVVRHSGASPCASVRLAVRTGATILTLEVRDDGRGLPQAGARWHGGLLGMHGAGRAWRADSCRLLPGAGAGLCLRRHLPRCPAAASPINARRKRHDPHHPGRRPRHRAQRLPPPAERRAGFRGRGRSGQRVQEANALVQRAQPDVAVVDLSLKGSSGLEAIAGMRRAPAGPCAMLVLSMHDSAGHLAQALKAGAHGYLTKCSEPEEVIEGIHAPCCAARACCRPTSRPRQRRQRRRRWTA